MKILKFVLRFFVIPIIMILKIIGIVFSALLEAVNLFCRIIFWLFILTAIGSGLIDDSNAEEVIKIFAIGIGFYMVPWILSGILFCIILVEDFIFFGKKEYDMMRNMKKSK